MIHVVAERLRDILAAQPAPVLPSASIAPRRPGSAGDLPAVALSVLLERSAALGLSGLVRAAEVLPDGARMREDRRGLLLDGTVTFEAWAAGPGATEQLSRAVERTLQDREAVLREHGFVGLRATALEAAEPVRSDAGPGAAFSAWRQRLACHFTYESIEGGEVASGGRIARIDVDLPQQAQESFSTPEEP